MPVYPKKVAEVVRCYSVGDARPSGATGRAASFECGCFVELTLDIANGICRKGTFRTNGCGYMAASASLLSESLQGAELRELHGLGDDELIENVEAAIGPLNDRRQCVEVCLTAIHKAFESHRAKTIAEYAGEVALICSCFGVSENTITEAITANGFSTVEQVSEELMAGRGCGSCRGLIDEIIDGVRSQTM